MIGAESFTITAARFAVLVGQDACLACKQATPISSLLVTAFEAQVDGYGFPVSGAAQLVDIQSINAAAQAEWERRAPWLRPVHAHFGRPAVFANACIHCGHATTESDRPTSALGARGESTAHIQFAWADAPLRVEARIDTAPWMERLVARYSGRDLLRSLVEQEPHRAAA